MLDGFILVDKEPNETTRHIDNYFQRKFKTRKVGHLGTLDPFATGLVIVAINKATKALSFLEDSKKGYIARLVLGKTTSSLDKDTPIIKCQPTKIYRNETVEEAVSSLLDITSQIPPMYSAIKVNGTPLYDLAREGIEIERKERPVKIFESKLIDYKFPYIDFYVKVSKGTYIRSLGETLAFRLNTIGYLDKLRRIEVDGFNLIKAKKKEDIDENDIIPVKDILSFLPSLKLKGKDIDDIKNGKKIKLDRDEEKIFLYSSQEALAIYKKDGNGYYSCLRGLF